MILQPDAPRAAVSALGVYGSRFQATFRIKGGIPTLGFLDAEGADIVAARAYFTGANPLNAREDFLGEKDQS